MNNTKPSIANTGNPIENVSRRKFLQNSAIGTGGLILGLQLAPASLSIAAMPAQKAVLAPSVFISIDKSGTVTLIAHRSEMGTGIRTSLPMIMADELEADWSRVVVEQAVGDKKFGDQYTDGSRSVVKNYDRMRVFGATARHLLEQSAARHWGVPVSQCTARNHRVVHTSGKSLDYGDLVETASSLPVPAADQITLKDPKDFRYIGKEGVPIVDLPDIITGNATFGIDVRVTGMKYASIEHCPVTLGKVKSYDDSEALKVPGVETVVEIPATAKPVLFKSLGGLAVVASNSWAAIEGRKKLTIEWDYGDNAGYDSDTYRKQLQQAARGANDIRREQGDVNKAFADAAQVVEAEYYVPHFVHAQMEPPAAVAHVHTGAVGRGSKHSICEVWSSCQDPQAARDNVASAIGYDKADVISRVPLLGGAFGRKSKPDFAAEAAIVSKQIGAPVKVVWTREDDIRHGYYHAVSVQHCKAGIDQNGKTVAWRHRTAFPGIMSTFTGKPKVGTWEVDFGLTDLPFDIPNICIESATVPEHVRIGWLRSVQNLFHAFAVHSFVHELATAAGRDPLEYNLELLGKARHVDLGVNNYFNYAQPLEKYPIDTGRLANVLQLAADGAGYGKSLPPREGIGVVAHRSFLTYVGTAVHVAVSADGQVSIPRVSVAIDAGRVINPDRVRAQMEGAVIYGMSAACYNEITAQAGRIRQSNFHDYPVVRMSDSPREIDVHIVESEAPPGGVGEPGTPGFAPALCNAIFIATGKRIRELPITKHDLSA